MMLALLTGWVSAAETADEPASFTTTKKLPELHHVVDVPLPDTMRTPKKLPLQADRKLRCATCHGLKDIDRIPYAKIDRQVPDFLRGGPYPKLANFCFECHEAEDFERPNVHVMVDREGKLKEDHCTYCHEEVHENRDEPKRRVDYKLRLPAEKLCYGCHLKTPHFNALEHQSVKPKDKMRAHMRESTQRHGVVLPLAADGKLMCATCHTPHQAGVLGIRNAAGKQVANADPKEGIRYREHPWAQVIRADKADRLAEFNRINGTRYALDYWRIDQEALLRLPAKEGTLCLACHQFER